MRLFSRLNCVYKDKTSYVRECFSKSVLLGTLDNPLRAAPTCDLRDISEGDQQVFACLCETNLCNSFRSPGEPRPDLSEKTLEKPNILRGLLDADRVISTTARARAPVSATIKANLQVENFTTAPLPEPARSLRCYKCGDLFNPDTKCRTDDIQTETCQQGEACLLYRWQKSPQETAMVRHCFSKQILLGEIRSEDQRSKITILLGAAG